MLRSLTRVAWHKLFRFTQIEFHRSNPAGEVMVGWIVSGGRTCVRSDEALEAKVRTYAYKDRGNPPKNLYPPPSAEYFWGAPRGMAYWERLHEILNREVVAERDRFFVAMLKRVGIEKGKPFNPTPRQKKILEEAAFVGEAMAKANDLAKRNTKPYWRV